MDYLTDAVEVFVGKELSTFENQRTIPFVVFVTLVSPSMIDLLLLIIINLFLEYFRYI